MKAPIPKEEINHLDSALKLTNHGTSRTQITESISVKLVQATNPHVASILEKKLCSEEICQKIINTYPKYWTEFVEDIDDNSIKVTEEVFQRVQQNYKACGLLWGNSPGFVNYAVLSQATKTPEEISEFIEKTGGLSTVNNLSRLDFIVYQFLKNYITIDNLKTLEKEGIDLKVLLGLYHPFNNDDLTFLKGLKQIHFDGQLQYLAFFYKDKGLTLEECQKLRTQYPDNDDLEDILQSWDKNPSNV